VGHRDKAGEGMASRGLGGGEAGEAGEAGLRDTRER